VEKSNAVVFRGDAGESRLFNVAGECEDSIAAILSGGVSALRGLLAHCGGGGEAASDKRGGVADGGSATSTTTVSLWFLEVKSW
jgi:hypothetical protein